MSFTFKFDEDTLGMSQTLSAQLVLASSAAPDMSDASVIAEAHKSVSLAGGALDDWLTITWDANDNPANGGNSTYVFNTSKTDTLINDIGDWIVQPAGSSPNVSNANQSLGYGCNKPTSMIPDQTTGNLKFSEAVFPKRVFSAYGADLADLLTTASRSAVELEISNAVENMYTSANSKFDAASGSVDNTGAGGTDTALGFKLYGQAVAAAAAEDATGDTPLTERLETLLGTATESGNNLTVGFAFQEGDEIHMNAKFTVSADAESPDSSGSNEASSYFFRLVLKVTA